MERNQSNKREKKLKIKKQGKEDNRTARSVNQEKTAEEKMTTRDNEQARKSE